MACRAYIELECADATSSIVVSVKQAAETAPLIYKDCRDVLLASASSKESSALFHMNIFLKRYASQTNQPFVAAEQLSYGGFNNTGYTWWDKMFGAFFTYLGTDAMIRGDPKFGRLAHGSSDGYASSLKVYFSNKFRSLPEIPVFTTERWRVLRAKLRSAYRDSNRLSGKNMVQGHASSSRTDREAVATGCLWLGTPRSAEFLHLCTTSYHFSGRGSEVSLNQTKHISVRDVTEAHCRYQILSSDLQRQKDGPYKEIAVYPFRDGIRECYYFTLLYHIVLNDVSGQYVFPTFSKAALLTKDSKSDSKVSSLWTNCFKDINEAFDSLNELMNQRLTSHCHKKGSNQEMAENPAVSGLAQIFRTGWELRGVDTLFEYISGSFVMEMQAGKAVSQWKAKIADTVVGGVPPSIFDITIERELFEKFMGYLFANDTEYVWRPGVRALLVGSLLRHYDELIDILEKHPDKDFVIDDHPFVARVKHALLLAGVSEAVFNEWKKQVAIGFFNRNLPGLPISNYPKHLGDKKHHFHQVMMDPRCFVDCMNQQINLQLGLHSQNQLIINLLQDQLRQERVHNKDLSAKLDKLLYHDSNPNTTANEEKKVGYDILRFSISTRNWKDRPSIADLFFYFFSDNCRAGFEKDKQHYSWSIMSPPDKKRWKNLFQRLKRTVKLMLYFCDSYPIQKNASLDGVTSFKKEVRQLASDAEKRIRHSLGVIVATQNVLLNSLPAKEWENKDPCRAAIGSIKKLPSNTPFDMVAFFNG